MPCEWVHASFRVGWGLRERGLDISRVPSLSAKGMAEMIAWVNWFQNVISLEWDAAPQELLETLPKWSTPIMWEARTLEEDDQSEEGQICDDDVLRRNFVIDKSGRSVPEVVPLPAPLDNATERLQNLQQRNTVGKCNACCKRVVIAERNDQGGIGMTAAHTGPYFHRPDCQLFAAKEFEASDANVPLAETGLLIMEVCVCLQHCPYELANVVCLPRKQTLMPG